MLLSLDTDAGAFEVELPVGVIPNDMGKSKAGVENNLEARSGIEPLFQVLQTRA